MTTSTSGIGGAETVGAVDGDGERTERGRRKADRRAAILAAAATRFAERGFGGVTIEEIGQAAGVSGPAVYRHFAGKASVLAAILLDASGRLLGGAEGIADETSDPEVALRSLISHHVAFSLAEADVIVVQDRELAHLDPAARHEVRALQRRYVEHWVRTLAQLRPGEPESEVRVRAHAAFGLMNSTPHSARTPGRRPAERTVARLLEQMAWNSLTV